MLRLFFCLFEPANRRRSAGCDCELGLKCVAGAALETGAVMVRVISAPGAFCRATGFDRLL